MTHIENDRTHEAANAIKAAIKTSLEESGMLVENNSAERCPVDTGRLRNSITHKMDGDSSVQVGTDVEYAVYVEFGHKSKSHYLLNAAKDNTSAIAAIFKKNLS